MIKPTQKALDHELRGRVPKGDYHITKPVTVYTEAIERKNFPISAATGPNPFAKSSGFTQPLNQTRSANEYEGNVNFTKEQSQVNFLRTNGTNMAQTNPYMQKDVPFRNFEHIRAEVLRVCASRSNNGLRGLRVFFKHCDKNGNGSIDPKEFKYAMREFGLELSEIEVSAVVKYFDANKDGQISFDELLKMLRGTLNHSRGILVDDLFNRLDRMNSGELQLQVLEESYQSQNHPAVLSGERRAEAVENEFQNAWSTQQKQGTIGKQEFFDYFTEVGAHIESDDEFEAMLR